MRYVNAYTSLPDRVGIFTLEKFPMIAVILSVPGNFSVQHDLGFEHVR